MVEKNDRDQENVFLLEFGLTVPAVLQCLFDIKFVQTQFTHLEKSYPYLLIFAPIKDFWM